MAKKGAKTKRLATARMCLEQGIGFTSIMTHLSQAENGLRDGGRGGLTMARESLAAVISAAHKIQTVFPPSRKTADKVADGALKTMYKMWGAEPQKLLQDVRKLRSKALDLYSEAKIACRNGSPLWVR